MSFIDRQTVGGVYLLDTKEGFDWNHVSPGESESFAIIYLN